MENNPKRLCKKCGIEKDITAFPTRKAPNGKPYRRHTCSNCRSKTWRIKNPSKTKKISKRARDKYRQNEFQIKMLLLSHIGQHKCLHCGFSDIRALCFHHRANKSFDIKWGFSHSYSIASLAKEAEKCDILCANCHLIHHYRGTNHRRDNIKQLLLETINQKVCKLCGHDNPLVLSFHHIQGKSFTIAKYLHHYSFNELLEEAKKCEVLCMNCHFVNHSQLQFQMASRTLATQDFLNAYNADIASILGNYRQSASS